MVSVTLCQQLLLLVLILKLSNAACYQSGELQKERNLSEADMTNTTELQHKHGEEACRSLLNATLIGDVKTEKILVNCTSGSCTKDNEYFYHPIFSAASLGCVELVRDLLDFGIRVESADGGGDTALHYAAFYGRLDMCRLLLDRGAKVDSLNDWKETPLHNAAQWGYLSVVKLLVERGADVSVRNAFGENVSDVARRMGSKYVAEWLDSVNESVSHDVDTEACNRSAPNRLTTSVRSQNLTAVLESGQQQGVQTAAGEPTEELDSVSRDVDKFCGPEDGDCRSLREAVRSGSVDRAKGLAMCDSSDNCTDGPLFPVTPQTNGPHPVNVDISSNNSQLMDGPAEVKASRKTPVTTATSAMPNDYDQIAKEFEDQIAKEFDDQIAKEFEEQITKKFADKIAKEFQDQTAKDDVWKKVLEGQSARDDVWKKVLVDQTAKDDVKRKVLGDQTTSEEVRRKVLGDRSASDDVRRKVLGDQTASDVWRKVLGDRTAGDDMKRKVLDNVKLGK